MLLPEAAPLGACELAIYRYLPRYWLREAQRAVDLGLGLGLIRSTQRAAQKKRFKAWPDRARRLPRLLSGT